MTTHEAAQVLGVTPKTVRVWIRQGWLTAFRSIPLAPWRIDDESVARRSKAMSTPYRPAITPLVA